MLTPSDSSYLVICIDQSQLARYPPCVILHSCMVPDHVSVYPCLASSWTIRGSLCIPDEESGWEAECIGSRAHLRLWVYYSKVSSKTAGYLGDLFQCWWLELACLLKLIEITMLGIP